MRGSVLARNTPRAETDVGYANARLRGMKANLLKASFLDELIEAPDVQHAVQVLQGTSYGPDIEGEVIHGVTAASIDEALKDNVVRTFGKVFDFLDPGAREILTVLLGRWDVQNIKTVLRGAQNSVALEQVKESLLPLGFISEAELEALARINDVHAVISTMATWGIAYANPLRAGYSEYATTGDLSDLELALDRYWASFAASELDRRSSNYQVARRILNTQIDVLNLVMVFRLLRADATAVRAQRYFLEGGRFIGESLFLELAQLSDVDEVLDRLKKTPYAEALDTAALRYLELGSISAFERALEMLLTRQALLSGVRDPQGIGVAISYLYAKLNEITNLRIVIRGKAVGMPAERVREDLILV
jgi:V/A-type H+-transporting ATPase subunit C